MKMLDLLREQTTFLLLQKPTNIFFKETANTYAPRNIYESYESEQQGIAKKNKLEAFKFKYDNKKGPHLS